MRTTTRPMRRTAAALACLVAVALPAHAGLQDEVNTLINGLENLPGAVADGVVDNTQLQAPGAFNGQTYHTGFGGSVTTRFPIRNIQPLSIEMPRFSAGCGGIDAYMGSFSFLSADKLVEFLKATAMNAVGVTTQLAISAITPLLGDSLKWAQGVVNDINAMNVNSCEAANAIVGKVSDQFYTAEEADCMQDARSRGDSAQEAKDKCTKDSDRLAALQRARQENPDLVAFRGNLTWAAFDRLENSTLDNDERQLVMSMIGTYVYAEETAGQGAVGGRQVEVAAKAPRYVPPTIDKIQDLLVGNSDDQGAATGRVKVKLIVCESDQCLFPQIADDEIDSLTVRVENDMMAIVNAIRDRTPLQGRQLNFINNTQLPVWKMLSVGTMNNNSTIAELMVQKFKHAIAADYALQLIHRTMHTGLMAIELQPNLIGTQQEDRRRLSTNAEARKRQFAEQVEAMKAKHGTLKDIVDMIDQLERQLRSQMPQQVVDLMAPPGVRG